MAQDQRRHCAPSRPAQVWAQSRLATPEEPGYHFHARQMGIPLVCSLGPGLPVYIDGSGGRPVCQGAVAADHARMVYEAGWTAACLRMEFQRCKSARTRLGRATGIQDGEKTKGHRRPGFPEEDLSKASDQLYLVDQPQRPQWQQHL